MKIGSKVMRETSLSLCPVFEDFISTTLIVCMFGVVEGSDSVVRTHVKIAVEITSNDAVCGFL